jgi:hypothetical protein
MGEMVEGENAGKEKEVTPILEMVGSLPFRGARPAKWWD